ncbi:hypothetical protein TgHK011_003370 [Trichoderma gracile]|nr:hypothetical protein TgHK011_003370 [Trichoderma gracile]
METPGRHQQPQESRRGAQEVLSGSRGARCREPDDVSLAVGHEKRRKPAWNSWFLFGVPPARARAKGKARRGTTRQGKARRDTRQGEPGRGNGLTAFLG